MRQVIRLSFLLLCGISLGSCDRRSDHGVHDSSLGDLGVFYVLRESVEVVAADRNVEVVNVGFDVVSRDAQSSVLAMTFELQGVNQKDVAKSLMKTFSTQGETITAQRLSDASSVGCLVSVEVIEGVKHTSSFQSYQVRMLMNAGGIRP